MTDLSCPVHAFSTIAHLITGSMLVQQFLKISEPRLMAVAQKLSDRAFPSFLAFNVFF